MRSSGDQKGSVTVGLISDTHGQLDDAAIAALGGCARIIHAGDVVDIEIIERLSRLCPVTAVRGNMDRSGATADLAKTALVKVESAVFFALHDICELDLEPAAAGVDVVVHGHTHRPEVERRGGVLFVNPGSASRPRGGPATVAVVEIGAKGLAARIVSLGRG